MRELIALAKREPGKLNIAVAGAAGELMDNAMKLQANIDIRNIPYKGGAQAAFAVVSGEADMTFTSYVVIAPHVNAGKLRVLGVTGAERCRNCPMCRRSPKADCPVTTTSSGTGFSRRRKHRLRSCRRSTGK